jgi:hypothetical protein
MLSTIIATIVIAYSLYNLYNINRFIINANYDRYTGFESLLIVFIYLWLIFNVFTNSGPIVLVLLIAIGICDLNNTKSYLRMFFTLLIITTIIIAVNDLYYNFNMWKYLFKLIF